MTEALKNHWREYLIEAWCFAACMISACALGIVLFHTASPLAAVRHTAVGTTVSPSIRR